MPVYLKMKRPDCASRCTLNMDAKKFRESLFSASNVSNSDRENVDAVLWILLTRHVVKLIMSKIMVNQTIRERMKTIWERMKTKY